VPKTGVRGVSKVPLLNCRAERLSTTLALPCKIISPQKARCPLIENLDFFATLAQVSAGILAIAIVTFQIKVEFWRNDILRHMIVIRTLGEFVTPLFFSLVTLHQDHNWRIVGTIIGIAGCLFVFTQHIIGVKRWSKIDKFSKTQLIGSILMYFEYGAILLFSTVIPNISYVSYILIWLIFSGTFEAWWFLYPSQDQNNFRQAGKVSNNSTPPKIISNKINERKAKSKGAQIKKPLKQKAG
jgi:hypothetical protein